MKHNKIVIQNSNWGNEKSNKDYAIELFNVVAKLINGEQLTIEIQAGTDFEIVAESVSEIADLLVEAWQIANRPEEEYDEYQDDLMME